MGINGVGSYYAQNYTAQNPSRSIARNGSGSKDESIGNATLLSESSNNGKKTGVTTVGNQGYIEMYADSSMEQDPVVKIGDYISQIHKKIEVMQEKIDSDEVNESFQIGGQTFTVEEWDEFLKKFDSIQEAMEALMKERHAKLEKQQLNNEEVADETTTEMIVSESTSCIYPTDSSNGEDVLHITWYTEEGIFCRKAGQTEGYEWCIPFENKGQYDKVMEFISQIPQDCDWRFASQEGFWKDFLDDEIDMGSFIDSIKNTNKKVSSKEYIEEFQRRSGEMSVDATAAMSNTRRTEIKVSNFKEYETANYKVVPCNDGAYSYFNIYKNGENAGAFFYSDICIKRDSITGTEVLLSEHGTGAGMYNVIPMDEELKQALKGAMGVDELPTEELSGYSIKTHLGTGIQYVMKNGAEGRGGTPLLRSQRDIEKYNELTQTYMDKYPNLVTSQGMAEMYASFEICGCMHRTETGIMKVFCDGISYNDNHDYKKNWAAKFDDATWDLLYEWLEEHQNRVNDFDKFQSWADILDEIGGTCERIWSDEELDQGYLNN